jgi:hypothetical protein
MYNIMYGNYSTRDEPPLLPRDPPPLLSETELVKRHRFMACLGLEGNGRGEEGGGGGAEDVGPTIEVRVGGFGGRGICRQ